MGKGKSWGVANEVYARSVEAGLRREIAQLSGVVHRAAGLLGCEASMDGLDAWCARETARRVAEREQAGAMAGVAIVDEETGEQDEAEP